MMLQVTTSGVLVQANKLLMYTRDRDIACPINL